MLKHRCIRLESELTSDTSTLILDASRLDSDRTQLDNGDKLLLEDTYGKFTRGNCNKSQTSNVAQLY